MYEYDDFGNVIWTGGESFVGTEGDWPYRVTSPQGAPLYWPGRDTTATVLKPGVEFRAVPSEQGWALRATYPPSIGGLLVDKFSVTRIG